MGRPTELERLKRENERLKRELEAMRKTASTYEAFYEGAKKEIGEEIHRSIGDSEYMDVWTYLIIKKFADGLINKPNSNAETCVVCGEVIPEGRQICLNCEEKKE